MLIAIPTDAPGGLAAPVSEHFGHCDCFTLVKLQEGKPDEVDVVDNQPHQHGGCMAPVMLLKQHAVDMMLVGGMGRGPLNGFTQVGIAVYHKGKAATAQEAVERFTAGRCEQLGQAQTCGGGGGGCGHQHHRHEEIERVPIEGKADVQPDRLVTFDYKLSDSKGTLLDSSEGFGPMRYLHGHGNIVPGLEKALVGLEVGAHKVVEVPCAEAYGERDESRVINVPREQLPPHARVGAMVQAETGDGHILPLVIIALDDTTVRLDANHPMAGHDLIFDVTIRKVESATAEEIARGHVH